MTPVIRRILKTWIRVLAFCAVVTGCLLVTTAPVLVGALVGSTLAIVLGCILTACIFSLLMVILFELEDQGY